jgi:hypothetical protein
MDEVINKLNDGLCKNPIMEMKKNYGTAIKTEKKGLRIGVSCFTSFHIDGLRYNLFIRQARICLSGESYDS